jgi:hypothetical protein
MSASAINNCISVPVATGIGDDTAVYLFCAQSGTFVPLLNVPRFTTLIRGSLVYDAWRYRAPTDDDGTCPVLLSWNTRFCPARVVVRRRHVPDECGRYQYRVGARRRHVAFVLVCSRAPNQREVANAVGSDSADPLRRRDRAGEPRDRRIERLGARDLSFPHSIVSPLIVEKTVSQNASAMSSWLHASYADVRGDQELTPCDLGVGPAFQ